MKALPARDGGRRMRQIATGTLVVMAVIYGTARAFQSVHPAIGFVRAFAEAAMVGGLADWFAVTACSAIRLACRSRTPRSFPATKTVSARRWRTSCAIIS
jgi:hypothetical protein